MIPFRSLRVPMRCYRFSWGLFHDNYTCVSRKKLHSYKDLQKDFGFAIARPHLYRQCTHASLLIHRHGQPRCLMRKAHKDSSRFVPEADPTSESDMYNLTNFVRQNRKILVLTGAGISTESGIPDYRSEGVGLYARSNNRPVQYSDFVRSASIRQRYWARNFVGWPQFSSFLPNICHKILRQWEISGKLHWLVTQNVDALHFKAGSEHLTELHGSAHRVMCLNCDNRMPRTELQDLIHKHNPSWRAESVEMAPDGDVRLNTEQVQGFKVN